MLDEQNRGAGIGRSQRCTHAGRSAAGNQNVWVDVPFVVGAVCAGPPVDLATWGELPQNLLVQRPQELRTHEGLVVEARRQEAPH